MLNQKRIHNELYVIAEKIEWICSPPLSQWMNGAVEAVIKLIKHRLKPTIQDRLFKEEALSTYLTEVEAVLNNCPLTLISDDVSDLEPLIHNHFVGSGNTNFRFNTSNEADIDHQKHWKSVQATSSMFWKQ